MLFNSLIFLIFGFLFFVILPQINKLRNNFRWLFFTFASFVFYGWWDWRFLFLIIGSGLIDFFAGKIIFKKPKHKTFFLILSLIGNLGSLAAFKYSSFFAENISLLLSNFGIIIDLKSKIPEFMLILPVGISFYTFQSMSYTIDVYRGRLKPTDNILQFFSYLAMFPQLVAGPIVRARDLLPQLKKVRKVSDFENWNGFKLILVGFFKKVVLADNIAPLINYAFSDVNTSTSTLYWWIAIIGFAFQIYFDFSGYSDIARGLAKWMGFHFRVNFNHPYISTSIREFWTRWHISLSTWFKDYVYIPIGGSKKGKLRGHLNMWITMIVSGFWHGAAWTFVIWGALHAFFLSLERIFKIPKFLLKFRIGKIFALALVLFQVMIAWVFFRADSFGQAIQVTKYLLNFNFVQDFNPNDKVFINGIFFISVGILIESFFFFNIKRVNFIKHINLRSKRIIEYAYFVILILAIIFFRGKGEEFIYFQF
ncbi:MAG: MBOAT family protein [Bacteroidales bacterium]|nr:MBOAT family protein [Bacteroidales bacterium]